MQSLLSSTSSSPSLIPQLLLPSAIFPAKMSDAGVKSSGGCCYYSVLGLCKQASAGEIRGAYRKLAMKWHPDRWMKDPEMAAESKRRFQQIQEAYSVLSNKGKRSIYDAGLLSFLSVDDNDEGFCDFMHEMALMMQNVTQQGKKKNSLEDLRGSLMEMMGGDEHGCPPLNASKRTRLAEL